MSLKTRSEVLFEKVCSNLGIPLEVIPTGEEQTPDYQLFFRGHEAIAEVKQIEPNEAEQQEEEKLQRGEVAIGGGIPGARVRLKISAAGPQLAARAKGRCPSILVLYNSVHLAHHTDPYHIRSAMYGLEAFVLAVPRNHHERPYFLDRKFSPKRKMTLEHNTSISALGVIFLHPQASLAQARLDSPYLLIYHNIFAAIPLPPEWLRPYGIRQFTLAEAVPGKYQDWVEVS